MDSTSALIGFAMFDVDCAMCGTFITKESQEKTSGGASIISVGMMIDDRMFWYGMSGVFDFIVPPPKLKKGDQICNNCMTKQKDNVREAKTVKCVNCEEMFQATSEVTLNEQGWGCAADVYEKHDQLYVRAGWGSKYDCMRYKMIVPVLKPGGEICDKCVADFIEEGTLVRDDDATY